MRAALAETRSHTSTGTLWLWCGLVGRSPHGARGDERYAVRLLGRRVRGMPGGEREGRTRAPPRRDGRRIWEKYLVVRDAHPHEQFF